MKVDEKRLFKFCFLEFIVKIYIINEESWDNFILSI